MAKWMKRSMETVRGIEQMKVYNIKAKVNGNGFFLQDGVGSPVEIINKEAAIEFFNRDDVKEGVEVYLIEYDTDTQESVVLETKKAKKVKV